jgi:hypothetical protein
VPFQSFKYFKSLTQSTQKTFVPPVLQFQPLTYIKPLNSKEKLLGGLAKAPQPWLNGGMKQQPKSRHSSRSTVPAALACPPCELCAVPTRFVGLESIPDSDTSDLCTYECNACGHVQANVIPRDGAADSGMMRLRH